MRIKHNKQRTHQDFATNFWYHRLQKENGSTIKEKSPTLVIAFEYNIKITTFTKKKAKPTSLSVAKPQIFPPLESVTFSHLSLTKEHSLFAILFLIFNCFCRSIKLI